MTGSGEGRRETKDGEDQTQAGRWLYLKWLCSVWETSKPGGLGLQEGVGWKPPRGPYHRGYWVR